MSEIYVKENESLDNALKRFKRSCAKSGGLGHRASHGCIRMKVKEVKWIYDNCPEGTTVVIQD